MSQSSKARANINRDIAREAVRKYGYEAVSLVAINDIWSALRVRPADLVDKK